MSNKEESIPDELVLYEDKEKTIPLKKMDLGRIPLGTVVEKKFYIANESGKWPIQKITVNNPDADLRISHPEFLMAGEVSEVKMEFQPSLSRREPLDVKNFFTAEMWIG